MLCERCQREIEPIVYGSEPGTIFFPADFATPIFAEERKDAEASERPARKNQGRAIRVQRSGDQPPKSRGGDSPIWIGFDGRTYRQTSMDEYFRGLDSC